jgi:hypothetical protein
MRPDAGHEDEKIDCALGSDNVTIIALSGEMMLGGDDIDRI